MPYPAPKTVALTVAEKEWLMDIYTQRSQNLKTRFFRSFLNTGLQCIILFCLLGFISNVFLFSISLLQIVINSLLNVPILLLLIVVLTIITRIGRYYAWALPYRTDALSGIKQLVPFTVISKEYFEVTGQYFVWLEGYPLRHYEIEADAWNSCEEGGVLWLGQGISSKYIFCYNDHVTVKLDYMVRPRFKYDIY